MDNWEEISDRLDKELEEEPGFPTDEVSQALAKMWYWKGISNYAKLMAEGVINV